jgi:hypothetical protein
MIGYVGDWYVFCHTLPEFVQNTYHGLHSLVMSL